MKQQTTERLKLVQWVNDGYPPIDLNKQVTYVTQLVNAYNKLREDNAILAEVLYEINCLCAEHTPESPINVGAVAKISITALNRIS